MRPWSTKCPKLPRQTRISLPHRLLACSGRRSLPSNSCLTGGKATKTAFAPDALTHQQGFHGAVSATHADAAASVAAETLDVPPQARMQTEVHCPTKNKRRSECQSATGRHSAHPRLLNPRQAPFPSPSGTRQLRAPQQQQQIDGANPANGAGSAKTGETRPNPATDPAAGACIASRQTLNACPARPPPAPAASHGRTLDGANIALPRRYRSIRPAVTGIHVLSERTAGGCKDAGHPIAARRTRHRHRHALRLTSEGMHIQTAAAESTAMAEHLSPAIARLLGKALHRAGVADDASSMSRSRSLTGPAPLQMRR